MKLEDLLKLAKSNAGLRALLLPVLAAAIGAGIRAAGDALKAEADKLAGRVEADPSLLAGLLDFE